MVTGPSLDLGAVLRVLRSGQYILGPEVKALESEIAARCGCAHGVAVTSETDALLVRIMAEGARLAAVLGVGG